MATVGIILVHLLRIANSGCGHFLGILLDTCTEILHEDDYEESFMYTCNIYDYGNDCDRSHSNYIVTRGY